MLRHYSRIKQIATDGAPQFRFQINVSFRGMLEGQGSPRLPAGHILELGIDYGHAMGDGQ
jgi:hypothetical protein